MNSLPPISGKIRTFNNNNNSPNRIKQTNNIRVQSSNKYQYQTYNNNNNNNEETKSYIDDMKKGSYNILVCVRCRPLSQAESQLSPYETIRIMDSKMVVLIDPIEYNGPSTVFKNRNREQTYAFDFAFDKNTSQKIVFENSTKFLIEGVVNGYNATVFAYGATGAGKTYTMLGNDNNPGIMPLTLKELFNKVNSFNDRDYKLKFWYLEIYNENIRDLLKFFNKNNSNYNILDETTNTNNNNINNDCLDLREDPEKGIIVNGITEINVNNSNDMLKILKRGNRNRTQEATGANETSSRSHAILQVSIEYKDKNSGINFEIKYSKLSLIDLAGSERASATQNRGMRLIEGANINRSLLTLGNCINALCDANAKGIKKPYIPYRDSKLTRLLKDSLGGNARTVMIANVAPSINTFDDTYNTLKYANRAKNIKTYVSRNVLNAQYHISNYVNIINGLKAEVSKLKNQLRINGISNNNNANLSFNNNVYNDDNNISTLTTINNNNNENNNNKLNDDNFEKVVREMKRACECQVATKQKIISFQSEINKLNDLVETTKNISSINKENNNSKLNGINDKLNNLKRNLQINQNRYKEFSGIIERIYNVNNAKSDITEMQKDFLTLIMKNSSYKIQILDNKYNNLLTNSKNDKKDEYIIELENQVQIRDEIITENQIDLKNCNKNIKSLNNLRIQYKSKIPKLNEFSSSSLNFTSGNYRKSLPPLSSNTTPVTPFINTQNNNNINSNFNNANSQNFQNKYKNNDLNKNNSKQKLFSGKSRIYNYNSRPISIISGNNNKTLLSGNSSESNLINRYGNYRNNGVKKGKNNIYIRSNSSKKKYDFYGIKNSKAQNYSFCGESSLLNNNDDSFFNNDIPQVKKSDLNNMINLRNLSRQKRLDQINSKQ